MERIIGEIEGNEKGPLLIFVGGIHGNETTGITALEKVFKEFSFDRSKIKGRAIALRGNLEALRQNIRYVSMDLNRMWDVKHFKRANDYQAAELFELHELRKIVEKELSGTYERAYLIDLHTTSAPTIPFLVTKDSLANKLFVEKLNVPYITGLIGYLDGTMLGWMCEKGHCGMAFESGQHDSRVSVIKHEAFVMLSMHYSGFLQHLSAKIIHELHEILDDELRPQHNHFELIKRYKIDEEEEFEMMKGFTNFQRIVKSEVLATNKHGDIVSDINGNIFMPLYQSKGDDGFFIIKPCNVEDPVST